MLIIVASVEAGMSSSFRGGELERSTGELLFDTVPSARGDLLCCHVLIFPS